MEQVLIVDGYNIIGATHHLQELGAQDLEHARKQLVDRLAEYQSYAGMKVYVIFDAHMVSGVGRTYQDKIEVTYTRENQTADEYIEKLVKKLQRTQRQIYVATSDYVEQSMIFGNGALRKPARELLYELDMMRNQIAEEVEQKYQKPSKTKLILNESLAEILEKWRRGRNP